MTVSLIMGMILIYLLAIREQYFDEKKANAAVYLHGGLSKIV